MKTPEQTAKAICDKANTGMGVSMPDLSWEWLELGISLAIKAAAAEAVDAEREACAKAAEECRQGHQPLTPSGFVAKITDAIRERGKP